MAETQQHFFLEYRFTTTAFYILSVQHFELFFTYEKWHINKVWLIDRLKFLKHTEIINAHY